jgi:predicted transcriptional regulator
MTNQPPQEQDRPEPAGSPEPRDDVIGRLRHMMPLRALTYWEHRTMAERQATRLLELLDQTGPAADLGWLTKLHRVKIVLVPQWRMDGLSGMTTWKDDQWLIGVNKGNPPARRRFTLAHELKHALDANRDKVTYQGITAAQRERIADYFAACYLMPKLWLRRAWTSGIQDPEALAGLFGVSQVAMQHRLRYLGFVDDEPERPAITYFRTCNDCPDMAA